MALKRMKTRGKIPDPSPEEVAQAVDRCVARMASPKEAPYFRALLLEAVLNHSVPAALLEVLPVPAREAGKTRFDQVYDATMALVFPGYSKDTLERLLGPSPGPGVKIWRVVLPERYRVAHVLIRASSYQQAFALGCDYVCRVSLRLYSRIPTDLTLRVMFMGERALRRYLDLRWSNRTARRRKYQLVGREISNRQMNGARLCALGVPSDQSYSVARYCDQKDLQKVRARTGRVRKSAVESESFRKA